MVFKKYKEKNKKWKLKMFFDTNYMTGKKKFTAVFVQGFGYIFWLFRTEQIYQEWPAQA